MTNFDLALPGNHYANFDSFAEMTHQKLRREERRYADFITHRHAYARSMSSHEYLRLLNSVSLRMTLYDPTFDFEDVPQYNNQMTTEYVETKYDCIEN